jgi:sugar lactone lactonase YvrE
VAATSTSCLAFAGDDLRTLVITTASVELSGRDRQTHPDSRRLFSIRVDVPGLPVAAWSNLSGFLYPAR